MIAVERPARRGMLVPQKEVPAKAPDRSAANRSPGTGLGLVSRAPRDRVVVDRGADRSCLARGVPDLDQGGRNGLRASAAPRGLRALALRLRHFRRKPSPAVCPCAPSGSSSSYGKRGSIRLRKSWPRQRRQQRQPKLELASRRASRPRLQFRPEILPIRNRPTRSPRRPRNPIRGRTRHSKLHDRKDIRHEGKVRRATTFRVGDDLVDTCRRSRAKVKSSARPSDRRHLTKLGARRTWVFLPGVTC